MYVTFDGHYTDDYRPYVFVSEDFGATWRALSTGLPETSVNRIREHPRNPRVLVLAHERGVHVSNDAGATWNSLATNMPTVSVDDAVFQERDNALVVGTHGRGIWVLDDVGPLEALTAESMAADATLLADQSRAHHEHVHATGVVWRRRVLRAESRMERGDRVSPALRARAGQAEIAVSDASGKVVRTLKGPAAKGVNRVVWDLRYSPPVDSANVPTGGGRGGGGGGGRGGPPAATPVGFPAGGEGGGGRGNAVVGPLVLPGTYSVRVTVPGIEKPLAGSVLVEADPLPKFAAADRAARQATLDAHLLMDQNPRRSARSRRVRSWRNVIRSSRTSSRAARRMGARGRTRSTHASRASRRMSIARSPR